MFQSESFTSFVADDLSLGYAQSGMYVVDTDVTSRPYIPGAPVREVITPPGMTCVLTDSIKCWGDVNGGSMGIGMVSGQVDIANATSISIGSYYTSTSIWSGGNTVCTITQTSRVRCWGFTSTFSTRVGASLSDMGDNLADLKLYSTTS